jgi:hypothetical protein
VGRAGQEHAASLNKLVEKLSTFADFPPRRGGLRIGSRQGLSPLAGSSLKRDHTTRPSDSAYLSLLKCGLRELDIRRKREREGQLQ